jgi:hypothetical protein
MDDNTNPNTAENVETEQPKEEAPATPEERVMTELERLRKVIRDSNEIIKTGKGRLKLEKPLRAHDREIDELIYDFTDLTGMEYTEAMDNGFESNNVYAISNRQALSLFAKAAAKQTEDVDQKDIMSQIGMTDALEGVQLAMLFFNASTQAGRMRISKR